MILSRATLKDINSTEVHLPEDKLFDLTEKVLQFGTGVFIRSFADYFIDRANKKGVFNGRIVVVKSTNNGNANEFDQQDGLYTICSKGIENGVVKESYEINAAISRVLVAGSQWGEIIKCASNPEMKVVISNTTEVGIQLVEETLTQNAPASFPGKLLAFLLARYQAFGGTKESGMIVIPAELIPDNGTKLKEIIVSLAKYNNLDAAILQWIEQHNIFCNSLVDRIVSGKPGADEMVKIEEKLGYKDGLFSVSELFSLWAIEGNETVKDVLSFSQENKGVVISENIDLYRELKLRLLNGTHTFNCGLAFLAGFKLTRDAMLDPDYSKFASAIMHEDIAAAIPLDIEDSTKANYANEVIERFCNPYIDHQWISITAQYTSKMKMRNLPLIFNYFKKFGKHSERMVTGFAGYLLFMKAVKVENDKYYGVHNGNDYLIADDAAAFYYNSWKSNDVAGLVHGSLSNVDMWGTDLTQLDGFEMAVTDKLNQLISSDIMELLNSFQKNKLELI
ncbi:MAG: tagaturonate reductase [Sphingobacteriales bacterium]|nr:tagaturonate reductase [Sphingobacteriales bacterium]